MDLKEIFNGDETFPYRLLSRMKSDCEFYLGYGNRCAKYLWAGNEKDQIAYMKAIWNSFGDKEKPEWLSMEQIEAYEEKMVLEKSPLNEQIKSASAKSSSAVSSMEGHVRDTGPEL